MIKLENVVTGVISDLHAPGNLDTALEFCVKTFKEHKVKQVVSIGDLVDHHYISRHPIEVDAFNPIDEFFEAKRELQRWAKAFPKMYICRGNHDLIPQRRLAELGIPADVFLKAMNEIYDLPESWIWDEQFTVFNDVLIEHGMGSNGMYGARNTAIKLGCSYVQGHTHSYGGVFDIPRAFKNNAAMNVGCLLDPNKYFARYGKNVFIVPPSIGCGVIHSVNHMEFIPMG